MKTSTSLQSLVKAKCPHCRQGDIYTHSAWNIKNCYKMHKHCAHCGFRYEIEPGFFFGAMYVSYVFSIAIWIGCGILLTFLMKEPPIWLFALVIFVATLIALPFSFRASRLIWLYLFVNYEPHAEDTPQEPTI